MGALCCPPFNRPRTFENEDSYLNHSNNDEERRRRAAEAAENRLKANQTRGVPANAKNSNRRVAHSELPDNIDSQLRWQTS